MTSRSGCRFGLVGCVVEDGGDKLTGLLTIIRMTEFTLAAD